MKIIKRSGAEVQFDIVKITAAVNKANDGVIDTEKLGSLTLKYMFNAYKASDSFNFLSIFNLSIARYVTVWYNKYIRLEVVFYETRMVKKR